MVATKVEQFGGMVPAVDDRLLPPSAAANAINCWLYSGKLVPLRQGKIVHELVSPTAGKVFRLPTSYGNAAYLFDSTWMEFEDPLTDIIRAPVFDDTFDRYYWVSGTVPPMYNTKERIEDGNTGANAPYLLGIPRPSTPTGSATGGSGAAKNRAYVMTFVSAYGEEGPPSLPVTITGKVDTVTWTVNTPNPDADDMAGPDRDITHKRLYRTITSTSGVTDYFFVVELNATAASYADTLLDADVALNEILPSETWTAPPTNLQGFVMLPNGIVASWKNNEVWFSEPYRPHAWPAGYVMTVEFPIIGMGVINQTLVVCTAGYPVTISGIHPNNMAQSTLNTFEPCTGRGSILSMPEGVYYASPNGLVLVNPGRAQNITRNLVTKDRWSEITGNARFHSARIGTAYMGFGSVQAGAFDEDAFQIENDAFETEDFSSSFNGVLLDPGSERIGFNLLSSGSPVFGVQNDMWSGEVFVIKDENVYWLDQGDELQPYEVSLWRSRIYDTNDIANFGVIKVDFKIEGNAPALNPVRDVDLEQTLDADQYGLIRVYADDGLVCTRELRTPGEVFRLPSGFKADSWYFEIEGRIKVEKVQFATTARELRAV